MHRRRRNYSKIKWPDVRPEDVVPTITLPRDPGSALNSLKPIFRKVHRIGGCSVVEYRLGQYGQPSFVCSYKGKKADRLKAIDAVRALREQFPRRIIDEIPGLRVWKLVGEHLSPVTRMTDFDTGPVLRSDELPTMFNTNGMWAIKVSEHKNLMALAHRYDAAVYGHVGCFGRVVEHTKGYRAEKIIIRKLVLLFPASKAFCEVLSQKYDCEVTVEVEI